MILQPTVAAAIARTISGGILISRLTPLKRILCMCPCAVADVPKNNQEHYKQKKKNQLVKFQVGMAISDPYLSRAERVHDHPPMMVELKQEQKDGIAIPTGETFPDSAAAFLDQIGHSDVGGILLALPMKFSTTATAFYPQGSETDNHDPHGKEEHGEFVMSTTACDYLQSSILSNYLQDDAKFAGSGLISKMEDRLFVEDALQMAREDPEMFEEVDLLASIGCGDSKHDETGDCFHSSGGIHPNVHAGVALNHFLWQHTGGWQNNTFG